MTEKEFDRIVRYMAQYCGMDMRKKKVIIEGRMDNYLTARGYHSYDEYMNEIEKDVSGREAQKMIDLLTTNHTYFLREPEHFDYFRNTILPELKAKEEGTRVLRIWCAASSSGEEPYTIAMVLKDFFGLEYEKWDTDILATDISRKVLETALHGVYSRDQLKRIPERWLRANFKKVDETTYQVKPEIRKKVMYRQFNLMSALPFRHKLHVVFLRNVMIYFDDATKRELLDRIYDVMEPGGYLIIGITESIPKKECRFEYMGNSIYRKPAGYGGTR